MPLLLMSMLMRLRFADAADVDDVVVVDGDAAYGDVAVAAAADDDDYAADAAPDAAFDGVCVDGAGGGDVVVAIGDWFADCGAAVMLLLMKMLMMML